MAMQYRAPWWLPGGHLQTIWASVRSRRIEAAPPPLERQRWSTPDGDFVDVDWLTGPCDGGEQTPLLVLFHGLEGSSQSHYAQAFASLARRRSWRFALPHFRGCSGSVNLAARAYHSGDHEEVQWLLERFNAVHRGPVLVVGVSLGGNALMRWAAEHGQQAARRVRAVAAVCAPLDLMASGLAMGRGLNRHIYTPMFLKTMIPKALAKLEQYPGLFERARLERVRDLYEFDNVFTAPLHGFVDTEDYWRRASALPQLADVRVPALVLNAVNDPFIPAWSLPRPAQVSGAITLWQPSQGGHVGFPVSERIGLGTNVLGMPEAVTDFLAQAL